MRWVFRCAVVEAFDKRRNIKLRLGSGLVLAMMNELGFEGVEEALHRALS